MDFLSLAKERYSVRKYSNRPIEPEKMEQILEAARVAPTARNNQPWRIHILKSPEALEKIGKLSRCTFQAPVVLMFTYNKTEEWVNAEEPEFRSGQEDTSIVATHVMLAAWDLGIGSCWVNVFPNRKTATEFGLPEDEVPVLLMPLGYAAEDSQPRDFHTTYRPMEELVKEW